jgi:hypothetical protein
MKTDDLRIVKTRPLLAPAILAEEVPLTDTASQRVYQTRRAIEAILDRKDARLLGFSWLSGLAPYTTPRPRSNMRPSSSRSPTRYPMRF